MRVQLSLGSNLGDRVGNLRQALEELGAIPGVTVCKVSGFYETEPVGLIEQPWFINIAAEIETVLTPLELLNAAQTVEARLGRKPSLRWGPRTVDIDLILCEDRCIAEERLHVPHPRFRQRAFVLVPLVEIAPDARDPITGQTVAELAKSLGPRHIVRKLETVACT
jgi:2-amino-4-hydroxy-6-hydroxymethyldihydropteridine diphosphokinase